MNSSRESLVALLVREVCQLLEKAQSEKRSLTKREINLVLKKLEEIENFSGSKTATSDFSAVIKLLKRGAIALVVKALYNWLFEND
jgi:hypothetical protein